MKKQAIKKMKAQVPMFGPVKEGTTCDAMDIGRHDWKSVPIAKRENFDPNNPQAEDTLVCMKCGVMSGTKNQFTQQGLAVLKQNIELMESQNAFAKELEKFREEELNSLFHTALEDNDAVDGEGIFREFFDQGVKATLDVDQKIHQKIQQRQMDIITSAMQRQQNVQ